MKPLLIPVLIAVLAGVGGGSGFAYMRTAKAFVADSIQRADSIKAHPAKVDSVEAHEGTDAASVEEAVPMTPADSLRAVEAARAETPGVAAADTTHGTKAAQVAESASKAAPIAGGGAKPTAPTPTPAPTGAPANTVTADVANMVRAARNEAMSTALPEQRLAKIFAAMAPKDAAKVMDQMPDADVRAILALMSDRSAAAILTQFAPTRAATITKGAARAPEVKP